MPKNNELDAEYSESTESEGTDLGSEGDEGLSQGSSEVSESDFSSKEEDYKHQIRVLNQRLVDARRMANSNKGRYNPQGQDNDQNGEGVSSDYFTSMAVATEEMRPELERRLDLYPELPAKIVRLIRSNPWRFVSDNKTQRTLNVENALDDVEQWCADYVAELEGEGSSDSNPVPQVKVKGKNLKPNTAPEAVDDSEEDQATDWEIPMDELEKKVNRIKRRSGNA